MSAPVVEPFDLSRLLNPPVAKHGIRVNDKLAQRRRGHGDLAPRPFRPDEHQSRLDLNSRAFPCKITSVPAVPLRTPTRQLRNKGQQRTLIQPVTAVVKP